MGLTQADFDWVTTYENSRRSKPSPAYYRDILERMGKRGSQCLMAGNNPSDDMSARETGMEVFLVTDCLENPKGLPIDGYPRGSFRELEARLAALPRL